MERLNSVFERLLFSPCRNEDAEAGGDNGNVWGDNTVMFVLHHRPGISECQKGVKRKTHRRAE